MNAHTNNNTVVIKLFQLKTDWWDVKQQLSHLFERFNDTSWGMSLIEQPSTKVTSLKD